jgi:hypothetical protein
LFVLEGFAPEAVAQLGRGGFFMLEYQKSSAAAPKPHNCFRLEYFYRTYLQRLALAVSGQLHSSWL